MNSGRGFTLIEVMVALVIFAVVSTALVKSASLSLRHAGEVEVRSLALWLAENELTRLRIQPRSDDSFLQTGVSRQQVTAGNRDWELETRIEATDNADIRRVTVAVYRDDADGRQDRATLQLAGFIGRH